MIKQTGHIIPKTRFITAQLNAWFTDGLWLELAQKANENATYLSGELSKFEDFKFNPRCRFLQIKNLLHSQIQAHLLPNLGAARHIFSVPL